MSGAIKLIVMGSGGVGKSAITCRYTQGTWVEKYDPTIEDQYTKAIELDGKAHQLEILDTAGQEEYSPLRETFMHTGDGFMLVYSITEDSSLEDLQSIHKQILNAHENQKVPIVVVANKSDLEDNRAVSKGEGEELAKSFGARFMEISAKNNTGITEVFTMLLRDIVRGDAMAGTGAGSGGVLGAGEQPANSDVSKPKKKKGCLIL